MVMEKEFIPYELALRMKNLGFNEPCFGMYQKNKKTWYCSKNNWITNFEVNPDPKTLDLHIKYSPKNVYLINGTYFLHSCSNFTAPLYQQAFRWFRAKYSICVEIHETTDWEEDNESWSFVIFKYKLGDNDGMISSIIDYDTYEEAELECLTKLIELVESKLK
jgi:hypothetical protein